MASWKTSRALQTLPTLIFFAFLQLPAQAQAAEPCGSRLATFEFKQIEEGNDYPTLSAIKQAEFKRRFCHEVTRVEQLFGPPTNDGQLHVDWWQPAPRQPMEFLGLPDPYVALRGTFNGPFPDLRVLVSDQFSISESLVPAALGHRGVMQFPAYEAALDQSAIDHELTHVFFPNGNRMLAEGLAVHVQDMIGNPAFPNYGHPLDELVRAIICRLGLVNSGGAELVEDLDKVSTPSPLLFHFGLQNDELSSDTYPIAGSFVTYLIKNYGWDRFHQLYVLTPLVPFARDEGASDRWPRIYKDSLTHLAEEWAMQFSGLKCSKP